ncbi:Nucleic acid-binding protein [Corchorus olitorius]|uniref:Nucleic acid-binding protein n=1 Tax=Corchorus olitorius TaxID=93759 RepID=A0A1R3GK88_9ROSI|nr:Nucleic acid-binding protein [Corchorus olitorius]
MTLSNGASLMEIDNDRNQEGEEDPFLAFIEYARSVLSPEEDDDPNGNEAGNTGPGWSWIVSRVLRTCISYSSGVTAAILLSDLSLAWSEQNRAGAPRKRPEIINQLKRKHRRSKLPNTVTIDSIYEKNFLSLSSVLEAVIVDAFLLPGTNIYMLTLGDYWSSNTIDLYLHRRYYDLVEPPNGILKKGREVFVTGCYLRTAREGPGRPRLLPTEYLVILLDERKQITLVDNDGVKLKFLLWSEQVILANLFSVGSMLALDRPYIASTAETAIETSADFCLEYGSATQLYLVPFIQYEEQVCLSLTQNRYQGSKLHVAVDPTQGPRVSQVALPCDSQGSIDYIDLRDKMTGISLYGVVTDVFRETNTEEVTFSLKIEDVTGTVWAKLHFSQSCFEVSWFEKDAGANFVNLSCLPALLNSSCLHKLSSLPDLSSSRSSMHICQVWLDQVDRCHVTTRFSHAPCGHFVKEMPSGVVECSFCQCQCNCDAEVVRVFYLKITLADENTKIFAWCTGQTATELLQISPDEFYELPEDEQVMYHSSLEKDRFTVALVNCKRQEYGSCDSLTPEANPVSWEITRALKCE